MASALSVNKVKEHKSQPKRQGKGFKMQLGLYNGPFLQEDLTHTNCKSTYLLASKEILKNQFSMSTLMGKMQKQNKVHEVMLKSNCQPKQSLAAKFSNFQREINSVEEESRKVKNEEGQLRTEIKICYKNINNLHEEMMEKCVPCLKRLRKVVKEQHMKEKQENKDRYRDIQVFKQFRDNFLNQIIACEKRIIQIQQFVGIQCQFNFQETIKEEDEDSSSNVSSHSD